jgi:hypothetical protein
MVNAPEVAVDGSADLHGKQHVAARISDSHFVALRFELWNGLHHTVNEVGNLLPSVTPNEVSDPSDEPEINQKNL